MQKLIDLPDYVKPLGRVYFGHGTYQEAGRCRYNEKAVYWQKYDPDRKHRIKDKPDIIKRYIIYWLRKEGLGEDGHKNISEGNYKCIKCNI